MFGSVDILGQSYRSPFMSQSVAGQTRNASNDPSAPQIFGSTTPFGPQTGSPIFGVTSNGVSAAAQSSKPFPSSTTFGASFSTDFGNTMSTFGASSTPAFSSSSSPSIVGFWLFVPFGSTCTPAFGSDGMPAFGATSIPAFGGTSPFGSTTQPSHPTFGSSIFGSSTPFGGSSQPPFGATSSAALRSTTSFPFRSTEAATGVSSFPSVGSGHGFYVSSTPASCSSCSTPASGSSRSPFGTSSNPTSAVSNTPGFGSLSTPSFTFSFLPSFWKSTSTFPSSQFDPSCPSGAQSSPFGAQSKTFGNTAFGISASGAQLWGSKVPPYTTTTEPDDYVGLETRGDIQSISAMPIYRDKTHEELRWQDYQLGDRGGHVPAGGSCFPLSTSNILNPAPTFALTSSSLFNTSTPSNIFAPQIPSFSFRGSRTSSIPITSSTFPLSTSPNLFTTSSSSPSVFRQASSPSLFSSSDPSILAFPAPAPRTDLTSNSGLFNSPFGVQSTTCGNTACGTSASGGQFGGSRVAPYTKTAGPDCGSLSGLYQSICGMRIYGDKSHEELRWQDYQLGDRGGRALVGGNCFDLSTTQSNVLNPAPAFIQTSSSRLNTSTLTNRFAPQIPAFTPTAFGSSFTPLISPNIFIPSASSFSVPGQISSPSLFSSSVTPTSMFAFPAPAPTTSPFNSSPINPISSIAQTGGTAGLTTTSSGGLFTIPSGNTHISHEERFPLEVSVTNSCINLLFLIVEGFYFTPLRSLTFFFH
ncbi:unnamed protein product [Prunus armeniaca]